MIRLEKVSKSYVSGKVALAEVSLEIAEGERFMLIGTSGSGKTTLLRMINRLVSPTSGHIWYRHQDITEQPATSLRRQFGYVIQQHGLFPHYTVAQNIGVVPQLLRWDQAKIKARTQELMDKFQIPYQEFKDRLPAQLSGGQKQRVGLARALAANPPVLLMDEPFGALDPITRINIRQELAESDELKQKTIIMVTHDVEEAIAFGDRICLLHEGKIQQTGTGTDLLWRPINPFTRDFFNHKRFELELKALRLADLLPYLTVSTSALPPAATAPRAILSIQDSPWQAFVFLIENPRPAAILIKEETNTYLIEDANVLTQAFQRYKTKG